MFWRRKSRRRGHPALQDGVLSLDRFVEMQHVQALMKDGTMYAAAIDTALANWFGRSRFGNRVSSRYRMWSNAPT